MQECDAQHAKFFDVADRSYGALPLEFLTFSWDGARNRLLVEYTRMGGTLMMGVVRK